MEFCLIDSNVRNLFFSSLEHHSSITGHLKKQHSSNRIKNLFYLAPPFLVYEMLGLGQYSISVSDNLSLAAILEETAVGSNDEVKALDDYMVDIFTKYRFSLESNPKFSISSLRKNFKQRKIFVLNELRSEFDHLFARKISNAPNRDELKDYLSLELLLAHDFKLMDKNRMATYFIVTLAKFMADNRKNSFYRAMTRIWNDSFKSTIQKLMKSGKGMANFNQSDLNTIDGKIALKKTADFLDSEGIHYLLNGYDNGKKVILITADPIETLLVRIGFYKSMHLMIDELSKPQNIFIPAIIDGLLGIYDPSTLNIKWIESKDIPPIFHYLEQNSYSDFLTATNAAIYTS